MTSFSLCFNDVRNKKKKPTPKYFSQTAPINLAKSLFCKILGYLSNFPLANSLPHSKGSCFP